MITVMDTLLKRVGLDFKFTVYNALACSNDDGIMAFVNGSKTVQQAQIESKRELSLYLKGLSEDADK